MRYCSHQFGSFDGKDNRKEVFRLLTELGRGLDEYTASLRRAAFLKGLVDASQNGFARKMVKINPMGAVDAYYTFVAITGVLGVDVNWAARRLEEVVRALG